MLVSTLAFVMALLVAQTRVEAGVHTTLEVVYGGVLGALVTPPSSRSSPKAGRTPTGVSPRLRRGAWFVAMLSHVAR